MSLYTTGKPTRMELEDYIATLLNTPVNMIKFVKLEDIPNKWKHACVQTGAVELAPVQLQVGTTYVQYAVCPYCAKVLYHAEDTM